MRDAGVAIAAVLLALMVRVRKDIVNVVLCGL
jgi:hypothetical protein